MKELFEDILAMEDVRGVVILSSEGEILFAEPSLEVDRSLPLFIRSLGTVREADLIFEKGSSWPVSLEKKTHLIDVAMFKEIDRGHRVFLDYSVNPAGFQFQDLNPEWQERYEKEVKSRIDPGQRAASPFRRLSEINPDVIRLAQTPPLSRTEAARRLARRRQATRRAARSLQEPLD